MRAAYSRGFRNGALLQSHSASSSSSSPSASTSTAVTPTPCPCPCPRRLYSNTASSGSPCDAHSNTRLQRDFFTSHITRRHFATTAAYQTASSPQAKSDPETSQHPLVKNLLSNIYCEGRTPDPDQTWQAYWEIFTNLEKGGGDHLARRVPVQYHQMTLRAIAPGRETFLTRRRARYQRAASQGLADEQFQKAIGASTVNESHDITPPDLTSERTYSRRRAARKALKKAQNRTTYHDRVDFILDRLQACAVSLASASSSATPPTLAYPHVDDYHHLLKQVVISGDNALFRSIWTRMQSQGLILGPSPAASTNRPDAETYARLIHGLLNHLVSQRGAIIRQQLHQGRAARMSDDANQSATLRGQHPARVQDRSAQQQFEAESQGVANSVVALFRDMTQAKQIQPTAWIMDLVCQVMRVSGRFALFESVLMRGYGIDLQNLDAPVATTDSRSGQEKVPLRVKSVNTILMALGEKKSASEMLGAFEVLRYPLGTRVSSEGGEGEGNLFETDFKGLLQSDAARSDEEPTGTGEVACDRTSTPPGPSLEARSSLPMNGTTFSILLQNLCGNHRISKREGTGRAELLTYTAEHVGLNLQGQSLTELAHRKRGGYVHLATYIAQSAVEFYADELERVASDLGYNVGTDFQVSGQLHATNPHFDPPRIQPTPSIFSPLHRLCSNQRLIGAFGSLLQCTDTCSTLLEREAQLLQRANEDVQLRVETLRTDELLHQQTPIQFRALLKLQRNIISQQRTVKESLQVFNDWNQHLVAVGYRTLKEKMYAKRLKKRDEGRYEELKAKWRSDLAASEGDGREEIGVAERWVL